MKQVALKNLIANFKSSLIFEKECESSIDFFTNYLTLIAGASSAAIGAEATAKLFTEVRDSIPEKMKHIRNGQH